MTVSGNKVAFIKETRLALSHSAFKIRHRDQTNYCLKRGNTTLRQTVLHVSIGVLSTKLRFPSWKMEAFHDVSRQQRGRLEKILTVFWPWEASKVYTARPRSRGHIPAAVTRCPNPSQGKIRAIPSNKIEQLCSHNPSLEHNTIDFSSLS